MDRENRRVGVWGRNLLSSRRPSGVYAGTVRHCTKELGHRSGRAVLSDLGGSPLPSRSGMKLAASPPPEHKECNTAHTPTSQATPGPGYVDAMTTHRRAAEGFWRQWNQAKQVTSGASRCWPSVQGAGSGRHSSILHVAALRLPAGEERQVRFQRCGSQPPSRTTPSICELARCTNRRTRLLRIPSTKKRTLRTVLAALLDPL